MIQLQTILIPTLFLFPRGQLGQSVVMEMPVEGELYLMPWMYGIFPHPENGPPWRDLAGPEMK